MSLKRFKYRAKEISTGKQTTGFIQAESERMAGKLLVDRGYVPSILTEEGTGIMAKINKVHANDRINFTRQFSTLVGAGLPVAQALRTVAEQTQSTAMRSVIESILTDVEAGRSLSQAFGKHTDIFDNVYLSLISAGEVSGTLDESLERIAAQEEKDAKMMSKIRGALTYPIICVLTIIGVFVYMMVAVVPQVEKLYDDLDAEVPLLTKILVNIKDFIFNFWWLVIIIGVIIAALLSVWRKTEGGKKTFASIKLNMPVFKHLFQILYMSRLCRISQILLSAGVSVLDTMRIGGNATNNMLVEESVKKAALEVQGGKALSVAYTDKPYILPLVHQMAAIGEQSGKMDEMLGKAAQVYEDELDEKVQRIADMIEPLLMIAMAGMAGVLVGGVLFPIYSLVNDISAG